eukprot:snap_masked-scaffold_3-processed-gene-1.15-mRNA-1 protein AED:0.25 eAED:0.28 QI:0/-1/0/1/-1/1/1/0/386
MEYSTLKVNADLVLSYNLTKYGTTFYKELEKKNAIADHMVQRFFNLFRFTKNFKPRHPSSIIFFRRLDRLDLVKSKLNYLRGVDDVRELSKVYSKISWSSLPSEILKLEIEVSDKEDEIKIRNTIFKQILVTVEDLQKEAFSKEDFNVPAVIVFNQKKCTTSWNKEDSEVEILYEKFSLNYPFLEYGSLPLHLDLLKADDFFNFLKKNVVYFQCIILDPPWKLANEIPTRGPALTYSQTNFQSIPFKQLFSTITSGFAFVWVIHSYEQPLRSLITELGYKIVDTFTWVKVSDQGHLLSSTGPNMNRAKETCLMISIGQSSSLQIKSNFGVDVILSKRREQSRKPDELYTRIEAAYSQKARFCEFFGRSWNARRRWLTIGNEIPANF